MAIYNLGQMQGNEANPIADALGQLVDVRSRQRLQQQELDNRKEIAKVQSLEEAKQMLAQEALKQASKTKETLTGTWQALSDKPETERTLFLDTDKGKEYLKTVKKYIPEVFDEDSKPIFFPSTKDQIKQGLDEQIATVKNKLLKQGPDSLTEGEGKVLQMEGYKDDVAEVIGNVIRNPGFAYATPQEQQVMIQNGIQLMRSRGGAPTNVNDLSDALNNVGRKPTRFKVTQM